MLKYNLSQIDNISQKILLNLSNTDLIFLFGELGSGKTTFTRSLINKIQDKNKVKKTQVLSPTFNLLYEYDVNSFKIKHYDLYRLDSTKDIDQLAIFENTKDAITIIEWPEREEKKLENRLEITFYHEKDEYSRKLKFKGFGKWKDFKINEI